ncbi:hypothetical protein BH11ACT5_BH11ACT5_07970 [soil metagenome]
MYRRPAIPSLEFRDESGAVIPYGRRWGMDSPPETTYSVTAHPERFAPLHDVARALMAELGVQPREGGAVFGPHGPATSLQFTPPNSDAAPLVIALTDFPGVRLWAGAHYSAAFPSCGCDACDDDVEECASALEQTVLAVLGGRLSESVSGGWLTHSIEFENGSSSGGGRIAEALPPVTGADGHPLRPRPWAAWA